LNVCTSMEHVCIQVSLFCVNEEKEAQIRYKMIPKKMPKNKEAQAIQKKRRKAHSFPLTTCLINI
jgi:hypothetical protein